MYSIFYIGLSEDTGLCEYKCNNCGKEFKGVRIGKSLKCPECHSPNTSTLKNKVK